MLTLSTFGILALKNGENLMTGAAAQRSRLSILAVLAVAGERGVSRDKLLGYFWPDSSEERARHALKQASYALRQAAGDDLLLTSGTTLRLNPRVITSDVADLQAANVAGDFHRVVDIYKAPFLDGVYLKSAPEFEKWVDAERVRLAGEFAHAVDHLAKAAEASGSWNDAVKWRRILAEHDPYSSRAAIGLIQALADAGDVPLALQQARLYETLLETEQQGEPDPSVAALAASLRKRPAKPTMIATEISPGAVSPAASAPVPIERFAVSAPPEAPPSRRDFRRVALLGVVAIAAAGTVGLAIAFGSERDSTPLPSSIAIMSFVNETGDTALSSVGSSLANRLTDDVGRSKMSGLVLAAEGNPTVVVTGRYNRRGDDIELRARITDQRSKRSVTSLQPVRVRRSAVYDLFDPASERILGALAVMVDDPATTKVLNVTARPPLMSAYREYAAGHEYLRIGDVLAAVGRFERAFSLDTTFAPALLMAAIVLDARGGARFVRAAEVRSRAQTVREWLSEEDNLGLAYLVALGEGNGQMALDFVRRAATMAPNSYWGGEHFRLALAMNLPSEAIRAVQRHPAGTATSDATAALAIAHHRLGNHSLEYTLRKKTATETRPGYAVLAAAAAAMADLPKIRELVRSTLALPGQAEWKVTTLRGIAAELRAHGHPLEARRVLESAVAIYDAAADTGAFGDLGRLDYARTLEALGRIDEAARTYEMLVDIRTPPTAQGPEFLSYRIMMNARGHLGALAARRGNRRIAHEQLAALRALEAAYPLVNSRGSRSTHGEHRFQEAVIVAALGDRARALTLLQQAFGAGYRHPWLDAHLGYLPDMVGYPPFESFIKPTR